MKKVIITIISALVLVSCTEEFITKEPLGVGSNLTFYNTPANCELAVNAIYDPLQWEEMYSCAYWAIGDVASDDAEKGGGEDARRYKDDQPAMFDLSVHNATPLNDYLIKLWKGYYIGIGRANAMIGQTESFVNGKDSVDYKRMRGEARFLRAFYYFDMVKIWGPVPLVTTVVLPAEAKNLGNRVAGDTPTGTEQVKEIYAFLISELEAIQNDLPWSYATEDFGRVTQGAVKALLAKVYLFNKDYPDAYRVSTALINDPKNPYALETHYQDVFDLNMENEQSKEIVFSIQYINAASAKSYNRDEGGEGSIRPTYVNPRYFTNTDGSTVVTGDKGYGFDMPTQNLIDEFNPADPRLDMVLAKGDSIYWDIVTKGSPKWYKVYFPSDYTTGYYCVKGGVNYDKFSPLKAQCTGKDYPLIRYSEVLLIAAEAGVQSGKTAEAKTYINLIRARARTSNRTMTAYNTFTYTPGAIPADLGSVDLAAVQKERRMEMYCEGQRYFDLVRWGIADEVLGAIKFDIAGNPKSWNPATLGRLPIPQEQIILHGGGNLIQNPGY